MIRLFASTLVSLLLSLPAFSQTNKAWQKVFGRIHPEVQQHAWAHNLKEPLQIAGEWRWEE